MKTEKELMKHVLQTFSEGCTDEKLFGLPQYPDSEVLAAVEEAISLGYLCGPGHPEHPLKN